MTPRYELLGWAETPPDNGASERDRDGPRLRLDWRRFAYAGKFVTSDTGKAVAREAAGEPVTCVPVAARDGGMDRDEVENDVVAAAAFNPDRAVRGRLRIRYVTVRADRRGEGYGSRLLAFVADRAADRGFREVVIAVNNPAAYVAAGKAGFGFTGRDTGLAELVCRRAAGGPPTRVEGDAFRSGIVQLADREDVDVAPEYRSGAAPDPIDLPGTRRETGD